MGKIFFNFFLFLMFIGGCAGSTACGIKIFRLQMLLVFLKNQIKKLISPNSVIIVKYNNQKISEDFIKICNYVYFFIFINFFNNSFIIIFNWIGFFNCNLWCSQCNFKCRSRIGRYNRS